MRRQTTGQRIAFWISVAIGVVFAIVPLPAWLSTWRPDVALLAVIYWSLTSPRIAGLGYPWLVGLVLDVLTGSVLGANALGFLVVAFLTQRLQLRLRMFTLLQQGVVVMVMLGLFHFLIFWIDGLTGHGGGGWVRWLPMISGAALWPLIVAAGDTLARRTS